MSGAKWFVRVLLVAVIAGLGGYQLYSWKRPLTPRLVSNDNDTRSMALPELTKKNPQERTAIAGELLQYQNDPDAQVRRNALYALRQLGDTRPEVLNFCFKSFEDADATVRAEAQTALSRFAPSATPALIAELGRPDGKVLDGIIHALAGLQEKAVPPLMASLKDPGSKDHINALRVLRRIGPRAKEAEPVLRDLLVSSDLALRLGSAEVLAGFGSLPKSAVATLTRDMLSVKDGYSEDAQRPRLARVLEQIDPRRRELVDLKFDLKQKNPAVRYRAAYILSEMNPANLGALEMLVDALQDSDVNVAGRALVALRHIDPASRERLKAVAEPRERNVIRRAREAGIDGFDAAAKLL